ncbi:MAG: PASTA domain-containing protein [Gammaproteobacteria bacterium]
MHLNHPKVIFLLALLGMMTACVPRSIPTGGTRGPRGSSFVELDENTEPRFVSSSQRRKIGFLKIDGNEIWLNNYPVSKPSPINNNDHVRTGYRSGAQILFNRSRRSIDCQIRILDFQIGTLYGEAEDCPHELETPLGGIRSDVSNTAYNVRITPGQVQITVIAGVMRAWLHNAPYNLATIGPNQELVLTDQILIGPRLLPPAVVSSRTKWRDKFDFDRLDKKTQYCKTYANKAVNQNRLNIENKCGFRDPRWHFDYGRHFDWCMSLDSNYRYIAERENDGREAMLNRCSQSFVSVPSLTGSSLQNAKSILKQYELKLGRTNYLNRGTTYTVVRQSPRPGSRVQRGSLVDLDLKGETIPVIRRPVPILNQPIPAIRIPPPADRDPVPVVK